MEQGKTIAVNVALIAFISIVIIWGNTLYRQWRQYEIGEKALAANNLTAAVAGYEAAIHMYTPFSSRVDRAAQRLWQITESCQARGDYQRALIACRSLRSSFYAVRGLYQPGQEWIARCDARIAELLKLREQGEAKPH